MTVGVVVMAMVLVVVIVANVLAVSVGRTLFAKVPRLCDALVVGETARGRGRRRRRIRTTTNLFGGGKHLFGGRKVVEHGIQFLVVLGQARLRCRRSLRRGPREVRVVADDLFGAKVTVVTVGIFPQKHGALFVDRKFRGRRSRRL